MINILTIEREYGSGAAAIAQKLADRLGWKLWDQLMTDEIARRLECDRWHVEKQSERKDPIYYRLLKSFMRGSFEGSLTDPKMKMADAEGIRQVAEKVVRAAASEGNCVIEAAARPTICGTFRKPSTFSFTRLSTKKCAGCNRKERARKKRLSSPVRLTGTGRLSSKNTSDSIGPPGISST